MKPTNIEFSFDDAKLTAINIFLKNNESDLSKELVQFMDTLYEKFVPKDVRNYIEMKEKEENKGSTKRVSRKNPNSKREAISGNFGGDRQITRPSEEKPTQTIFDGS